MADGVLDILQSITSSVVQVSMILQIYITGEALLPIGLYLVL